MPYRKSYMSLHDIDWYGAINGKWICASSMGGMLPNRVNDDNFLPVLQMISYNLPDVINNNEITINENLIERRFNRSLEILQSYYPYGDPELSVYLESYNLRSFRESYIEYFVSMARKGFHTFIRFNIDEIEDNSYEWVAAPSERGFSELAKSLSEPLPSWLNNKKLTTYLNQIQITASLGNLSNPELDLWKLFS